MLPANCRMFNPLTDSLLFYLKKKIILDALLELKEKSVIIFGFTLDDFLSNETDKTDYGKFIVTLILSINILDKHKYYLQNLVSLEVLELFKNYLQLDSKKEETR